MECCRICLATNELSNIFQTEEIAANITSIACVDISENDGFPQYICILCKHELYISITFKNKCETTYEMLREQSNKELEVKENIILNLLSGGNALNNSLPKRARESILNTVKKSVNQDVRNNLVVVTSDCINEKNYILQMGKDHLISEQSDKTYEDYNSNKPKTDMEMTGHKETNGITTFDDQIIDADDQTTTITDPDDQMTDITENEFELTESLRHRNQDLMCLKCNFCFFNKRCLFDHLKRIHRKTMEQCQICLSHFPTSQLLQNHLSSNHDISNDTENFVNRCKICNKVFDLQSELNTHLCLTFDQDDFGCELCGLKFKFVSDLENHIKYVHQQVKFFCKQCNENFDQFDLYSKHLKEHLKRYRNIDQIELFCSECNKCFLTNKGWNEHANLCHENQENLKGKDGKNFISDNHKKSFVCPLCEECFKTNSMLEMHVRIHTGEEVFKCVYCHKSFAKSVHLSAHQRIHESIKPHVCSICQISFHKKDNLESHLLQHDNLIKCTKEEIYIQL